jgi:hypothetical protein
LHFCLFESGSAEVQRQKEAEAAGIILKENLQLLADEI